MSGLIATYLCLSYYKGKITTIACPDNTNCSGTNGAGKTSALQLIPVFYGANPESLVVRAGGKDSFLDHYLPTAQSMLAFEYERPDGVFCAVMYRHEAGGRAVYRFVRGKAKEVLFTDHWVARLAAGMTAREMMNEIRRSEVECSDVILQVNHYRAVIQNDTRLASESKKIARKLLAMGQTFSVAGPDGRMMQMDDLTYAILKRSDMVARLKEMIIRTQFSAKAPAKPTHTDNKDLPANLRSLRDFDVIQPELVKCINEHRTRVATELEMISLARQLQASQPITMAEIESIEGSLEALAGEFKKLEFAYEQQHEELSLQLSETRATVTNLDRQINRLDDEKLSWEERNIAEKKGDLTTLPVLIEQAIQAEAHYQSLKGDARNIEDWRDENRKRISDAHEKSMRSLNEKVANLEKRASVAEAVAKEARSAELSQLGEDCRIATELYHGDREPMLVELARLQGVAENTGPTEDESLRERVAENGHESVRERMYRTEDELQRFGEAFEAAKDEQARALQNYNLATRNQMRCANEREAIDQLLTPGGSTLLAVLRRDKPGWEKNIGLVVDPDLLYRTDLDPRVADGGGDEGLFGVRMQLDNISPPPHAVDEADLRQQLAEAMDAEDQADEQLANAETELGKANNQRTESERAYNAECGVLTKLKGELGRAWDHYQVVRNDIREAITGRKLAAKKQVGLVDAGIRKLEVDHEDKIAQMKQESGERVNDINAQRDIVLSDIANEGRQVEAAIREANQSKKDQLQQIEQGYRERCAEAGVSDEMLTTARKLSEKAVHRRDAVEGYREEVTQYEHWEREFWSGRPTVESELNVESKALAALSDKIKSGTDKFNRKKGALRTQRQDLDRNCKLLQARYDNAKAILNEVGAVTPSEVNPAQDVDFTIESLRNLKTEEGKLRMSVLRLVEEAGRALSNQQDSQIAEAWHKLFNQRLAAARELRPTMLDTDQSFRLTLPEDIEQLVTIEIPHIRSVMISVVRTLFKQIENYHDELLAIGHETEAISRRLKKNVNTNQQIPALSDIALTVVSKVETIGGWKYLSAFKKELRDWSEQQRNELPPESLVQSLSDVVTVLETAHIEHDIGSLVDLEITLKENGEFRRARQDSELNNLASQGLSYLAVIVIFVGMARYLCPDKNVILTWPVDEIGTLDPANVARLFSMLKESGIKLFSALPSMEDSYLRHFGTKVMLERTRGASMMVGQAPSVNKFAEKLRVSAQMEKQV